MIQLSLKGKLIYQSLGQVVLLLLVYAIGLLLSALHQLPDNPIAPIASTLPLDGAGFSRFSAQALHLLILSGFLSAAFAMQEDARADALFIALQRAWTLLVTAALCASLFASVPLLDGAAALILLARLAHSRRRGTASAFLQIWQLGMLLTALSLLGGGWLDVPWSAVLARFQVYVGYGLCGLSISFWLMTRWSDVGLEWARDGLRTTAGLVLLAGGCISIAPLGWLRGISAIPTLLIPLSAMIFAAHSCRALGISRRATLSPHWLAAAALYWLIACLFSAVSLHIRAAAGHLDAAQHELAGWVMVAIVLAWVNAGAAELRGESRRVTGYVPLWLTVFGWGLALLLQICRGTLELYLRDVLALDAPAVAALLLPLTALWVIALLAVAIGILSYALGFWARQPQIQVTAP